MTVGEHWRREERCDSEGAHPHARTHTLARARTRTQVASTCGGDDEGEEEYEGRMEHRAAQPPEEGLCVVREEERERETGLVSPGT